MSIFSSFWFRFRQWSLVLQITTVLVVVILVGIVVHAVQPPAQVTNTVTVIRGAISQVVNITGQLTPVQSVDLSFQGSGRISSVPARVGAQVTAGTVLASLDVAELNAQLRNAQANVAAQQAKLEGLLAGSRPEDIAVAQAQADKAQQDLAGNYSSIPSVLLNAYSDTDYAMRVKLDSIFTSVGSDQTPQYSLSFSCTSCGEAITQAVQQRAVAEVALKRWKTELDAIALDAPDTVLEQALTNAHGYVQAARDTLAGVASLLNSGDLTLDSTTVQAYKTSVNTATTSVASAFSSIDAQSQAVASQKLVVAQYASALALKKAGTSVSDISAQRAAVAAAQAQADQISAQIAKNIIRSPIAGVVTRVDAKVGQSASANESLVSVISSQNLEIDANVPEIDVGNVVVGNHVDFTVDALPGVVLMASVSSVDPAETIIDGVVNFKIKAALTTSDSRLKSGLTANLNIQVAHKESVLILPQYAIIQNDQGNFVQRVNGRNTEQVPVVLGITSPDGMVEIVSGVSEGDVVANIGIKNQ